MSRAYFALLLVLLAALVACGNGAGGGGSSKGGGGGGGGTAVAAPVPVNISSGVTVSGINIVVPAPVASPPPNAQVLGVGTLSGTISAFNTGATIARNTTMRVILFGPGLSGSMQVSINGPSGSSDITISNVQSTTATDGTPGISFTAAVPSSAALGARSVVLKSSQNDITTFTGGLEVTP